MEEEILLSPLNPFNFHKSNKFPYLSVQMSAKTY